MPRPCASPIHVEGVRQCLERIKGDTDGQYDVQGGWLEVDSDGLQSQGKIVGEEFESTPIPQPLVPKLSWMVLPMMSGDEPFSQRIPPP